MVAPASEQIGGEPFTDPASAAPGCRSRDCRTALHGGRHADRLRPHRPKQACWPTDAPTDLVLSGINQGANLGEDISYSGTDGGRQGGAPIWACPRLPSANCAKQGRHASTGPPRRHFGCRVSSTDWRLSVEWHGRGCWSMSTFRPVESRGGQAALPRLSVRVSRDATVTIEILDVQGPL